MQSKEVNFTFAKVFVRAISSNLYPSDFESHRESAFHGLLKTLLWLEEKGYREFVLCELARQKGEQLLSAKRIKTVDRMTKYRMPYHDGKKYVSDPYMLPIEELIYWCEMYTHSFPMHEAAANRFLTLYNDIVPSILPVAEDEDKEVGGESAIIKMTA